MGDRAGCDCLRVPTGAGAARRWAFRFRQLRRWGVLRRRHRAGARSTSLPGLLAAPSARHGPVGVGDVGAEIFRVEVDRLGTDRKQRLRCNRTGRAGFQRGRCCWISARRRSRIAHTCCAGERGCYHQRPRVSWFYHQSSSPSPYRRAWQVANEKPVRGAAQRPCRGGNYPVRLGFMPDHKISAHAHLYKPRFLSQDAPRAPNRGESTHFSHLGTALLIFRADCFARSGCDRGVRACRR